MGGCLQRGSHLLMAERRGEQFDLAGEQCRAPDDLAQGSQRGVNALQETHRVVALEQDERGERGRAGGALRWRRHLRLD